MKVLVICTGKTFETTGTPEFINSEFRRIREEIGKRFRQLYDKELKPQL